jgi:hypothetical protein
VEDSALRLLVRLGTCADRRTGGVGTTIHELHEDARIGGNRMSVSLGPWTCDIAADASPAVDL